MKRTVFILLLLIFIAANLPSQPMSIGYFQTDQRYEYRIELLRLALDKTLEADGSYVLIPISEGEMLTQARGLHYLREGRKIDIAFLPTNREREQDFLPVRIPILQGILGYRIFLIHRDNLSGFSSIGSLEQLKKDFTAGFGMHWADMEILERNGLTVRGISRYDSILSMLENRRFDYFPRGINEIWEELDLFRPQYPDLTVEPRLAFYYPYPVYFFVNKNNTILADRIERGLTIALNDGSFRELFLRYHEDFIARSDLDHRMIFRLDNPTLERETQEPDTSWWLDSP